MAQLTSITKYLDDFLSTDKYVDGSLNGLQVEAPQPEIRTVALAVDAGESVIEKALAAKAELLIVHHGLLWGPATPITGALGRKISALMRSGCSLYVSHLPLDGNKSVGNAYELGHALGVEKLEPFLVLDGSSIGAKGELAGSIEVIAKKVAAATGTASPLVLPHGNSAIRRLGIVTGSGAFAIKQCAAEGLDLLISGEPKQEVFHLSKEIRVSAIFAGHYATETFGVRAVGRQLKQEFNLETIFIDEPTGI